MKAWLRLGCRVVADTGRTTHSMMIMCCLWHTDVFCSRGPAAEAGSVDCALPLHHGRSWVNTCCGVATGIGAAPRAAVLLSRMPAEQVGMCGALDFHSCGHCMWLAVSRRDGRFWKALSLIGAMNCNPWAQRMHGTTRCSLDCGYCLLQAVYCQCRLWSCMTIPVVGKLSVSAGCVLWGA